MFKDKAEKLYWSILGAFSWLPSPLFLYMGFQTILNNKNMITLRDFSYYLFGTYFCIFISHLKWQKAPESNLIHEDNVKVIGTLALFFISVYLKLFGV